MPRNGAAAGLRGRAEQSTFPIFQSEQLSFCHPSLCVLSPRRTSSTKPGLCRFYRNRHGCFVAANHTPTLLPPQALLLDQTRLHCISSASHREVPYLCGISQRDSSLLSSPAPLLLQALAAVWLHGVECLFLLPPLQGAGLRAIPHFLQVHLHLRRARAFWHPPRGPPCTAQASRAQTGCVWST